jgi:hypothetical protein
MIIRAGFSTSDRIREPSRGMAVRYLLGLRKQKIGARKPGAARNRAYLVPRLIGDLIAMLQWLLQNGPLVAWTFAALFTAFTVLAGKV